MAIAVRRPDGQIVVKRDRVVPVSERFPVVKLPLLRGAVALFSSLVIGMKALSFSANEAASEGEQKEEMSSLAMGGTIAVALLFGILLFFILPLFLTKLLVPCIGDSNIIFNLVDGLIRVVVFLLYVYSISRMKDIKRVFQYHGAEHKSIFAFEAGTRLTVDNVKRFSRLHPRCGTSFLILVLLISILVFSMVTWESLVIRILLKLVLIPVVVGISYELLKFSGRHDNFLTRIICAPGLWLQHLTTQEPDDSMIEVAIAAVTPVLPENRAEDQW